MLFIYIKKHLFSNILNVSYRGHSYSGNQFVNIYYNRIKSE